MLIEYHFILINNILIIYYKNLLHYRGKFNSNPSISYINQATSQSNLINAIFQSLQIKGVSSDYINSKRYYK